MKCGFLFYTLTVRDLEESDLLLLKSRDLTGFKSKCGDMLNIEGG